MFRRVKEGRRKSYIWDLSSTSFRDRIQEGQEGAYSESEGIAAQGLVKSP